MRVTPILQIGDAHFTPGARNADRYRALDEIVDVARTVAAQPRGLGAIAWPGDVFDSLSTTADRNSVDTRLMALADLCPVVLIYGNHDRPGDLDGFANLNRRHPIYVIARPTLLPVQLATDQMATFGCFPYPHRHVLVGARVAHGAIVETADALLTPLFTAWGAKLADARAAGHLTAFFFHANVVGARTSVGQPNIGHEIELSAVHLAMLGDIFKGGNHIHFPQEIYGARFAGSIAPNDYGEKERKRFLIASIAEDSSFEVESIQLTSLPMYHLSLRYLPADVIPAADTFGVHPFGAGRLMIEDADGDTRRRFFESDWQGCDVRARLYFLDSLRPAIDFDAVKALFASATRFKFESVTIPDRARRAPAVAAARTLPDKLAAMRSDGSPLPESVREKAHLLESLPHDEVVAVVETWLTDLEASLSNVGRAA